MRALALAVVQGAQLVGDTVSRVVSGMASFGSMHITMPGEFQVVFTARRNASVASGADVSGGGAGSEGTVSQLDAVRMVLGSKAAWVGATDLHEASSLDTALSRSDVVAWLRACTADAIRLQRLLGMDGTGARATDTADTANEGGDGSEARTAELHVNVLRVDDGSGSGDYDTLWGNAGGDAVSNACWGVFAHAVCGLEDDADVRGVRAGVGVGVRIADGTCCPPTHALTRVSTRAAPPGASTMDVRGFVR